MNNVTQQAYESKVQELHQTLHSSIILLKEEAREMLGNRTSLYYDVRVYIKSKLARTIAWHAHMEEQFRNYFQVSSEKEATFSLENGFYAVLNEICACGINYN